jgi:serine/threonine protein kinase
MVCHSNELVTYPNIDTDVIHGDIKPQNVLVFKDTVGKTTVKMADFGYSTFAAGKEGMIFLPKSRPWAAPEHHFGEFSAPAAKKTDVYSFGLLCLWILFGDGLENIPQTTADGANAFFSFSTPLDCLERLKHQDKMLYITNQLIESMSPRYADHKIHLEEFFSLTLQLNPDNRTSDLGKLQCLLGQEQ